MSYVMNKRSQIPEISLRKELAALTTVATLGFLSLNLNCESDKSPTTSVTPTTHSTESQTPAPSKPPSDPVDPVITATFQPGGGDTGTTLSCDGSVIIVKANKGDSPNSMIRDALMKEPTDNIDHKYHPGTYLESTDINGEAESSYEPYPESSTVNKETADGLATKMQGYILELNEGEFPVEGELYKILDLDDCSKENFAAPPKD